MKNSKNKTVLLTGASRGIGKAINKMLLKEGYKVLAPGRSELDLSDKISVNEYLMSINDTRIDILINNAGINMPQNTGEISEEAIEDTISINLVSPIRLVNGEVIGMKKRKWGRIVSIASIFGHVARTRQILYSATKHGIIGMTKALALELGQYNILVNSVSPGFTDTDLTRRNTPEKNREITRGIPLNRFATASEIAETVKFLISDKNTYINGTDIIIDGGFICG